LRPSIIKIAAWGDRHVASLQENIFPCLMAPGNLPALAASSPTELILYTDRPAALVVLRDIPGLTFTVRVLDALPDAGDLPANRRVLARTDADSARLAAARDADWFGLQADTLVSDAFLPRVKDLLVAYLAVAGSPVRMDLGALRSAAGARRAFDAADLRRLSMSCLHPVTASYFVRDPPTTVPADPHQLLFRTPDGFAARTWQFCPFGIAREGLEPMNLHDDDVTAPALDDDSTIDCYLVQNLPASRVRFHDPGTDDFYLTSLDDASGIPAFGEFEMSAAGIAESMRKFSRDYGDIINYGIALRQRFVYPTDVPVPDSFGEEETLDAIRRELMPTEETT
jgi:hypothetical protein